MTDHDFMVNLASSTLGYRAVPEVEDETKTYRDAFDAVVTGTKCDFYFDPAAPLSFYQIEAELELLQAIRRAASLIGASDAERWAVVRQELINQAQRYAECKAREAGEA